ncbi:hypothetical protein ACFLVO_02790 [Chloroflexota bacterium]
MNIIKGVTIRIVLITLLLPLTPGITLFPVLATGIAVTPSHLEISDALRGGEFERNITIYNPDPEITSYTLSADGDAGEWISFYKQEDEVSLVNRVTILGNENVRMLVKFAIPPDAVNGEHKAIIIVASVPAEGASGGSGQVVSLAAPVAVTIFVTGNQILSGVVNGINADDVEVKYPLRIRVQFHNTGNVVATPQIAVEITTQDGIAINQFTSNECNVKPQKHETIPLEWDTTGRDHGDYIADVSVVLGDSIIKQEQLNFAILPLGTLTRSGSLTELIFEGEPGLGVLTMIQATFVNTGKIDTKAKFIGEVYHNDMLIDTLESEELLVAVGNTEFLEAYFKPGQPGAYRVNGYVIYEGKKTEEKEISFAITEDGETGDTVGTVLNNVGEPQQAFNFYILAGGVAVALVIITIALKISLRHKVS